MWAKQDWTKAYFQQTIAAIFALESNLNTLEIVAAATSAKLASPQIVPLSGKTQVTTGC